MSRKNKATIRFNHRKKQSSNAKRNKLIGASITGKFDLTRSGMGFVIVEGLETDILIQKSDTGQAMNGDTVKVKITYVSQKGRPEGKIVSIIEHVQEEFIGRLECSEKFGFVVPESDKIPFDIFVPNKLMNNAKHGQRVLVKVFEWNDKKNPTGKITALLEHERDNQVAMKEILLENGFSLGFSKEALEQASSFSADITPEETKRRKDFRGTTTFTIDPHDAKDFDDALSIKALQDGYYEVGVHIADVSHFVAEGSPLDDDAYKNATSVYLPDRVLPMLPENISNVLCSLRPNEDKYTFSSVFEINKEGHIRNVWIGRTIIHSDQRYSYEDAQKIIEGGDGVLKQEVLTLNEIAKKVRSERFSNGALNFNSQEIRYQLDEKGVPIGITIKESKEAHQLIEEFMLLANKYVAKFVKKRLKNNRPIPFPYRVHPLPDEEKLGQFAAFTARFGYQLHLKKPEDIAESFNQLLQEIKGKPEEHLLSQLGIRTMAKAIYTTDNDGHYGLGFEDYCHFTSPIRRYPDVMVHRIVQQCIDNEIIVDKKMETKCKHCSDRERKAMESERSANKYKQVEYMQQFIGEDLPAIISGVAKTGFWAETIAQKCEGMVSMSDLSNIDNFTFIEEEYALVGKSNGTKLRIGDAVTIKVVNASLETKQIDFDLVSIDK